MPDAGPETCKVVFEPSGLRAEVPRHATILEAARVAGVYLTSLCGGDGTCGKCKVLVDAAAVEAPPAAALSPQERARGVVLACQARLRGDATVTVPTDHRLDTGRILVGVDTHRGPHAPVLHTFSFDPLVPSPDVAAEAPYAAAVDIGTTTVVAHLVDLSAAETLDAEAAYNSQIQFGDDYIHRIIHAEQHQAFGEMQRRIVGDLNNLMGALAQRHGVRPDQCASVVAAGNTAMIHFLFGRDAGWIRRGLDRPQELAVPPCPAADVGLRIHPRGRLYTLPAVGAYVGADIVAGVLATRLYEAEAPVLLIDIGTNGEVVLGCRDWMACASSSAGPAFEGGGIRHGMRAAPGAIERVTADAGGTFHYRTIGGEAPRGLCGSGLLDLLAAMLASGRIDRTGRFTGHDGGRLRDGPDGPELVLVPGSGGQEDLVITQADLANLIRSKAGVYAAITVLLEATDTPVDRLETVLVAGGFGNYLDPVKAVAVGLLPDVAAEKIRFVGNTSIAGAKTALMSRRAFETCQAIAGRMTYVDLMNHPHYMDAFMQANFLPHTDLSRFPSVQKLLGWTAARSGEGGP